jgi:hypothetical protein
MGLCNNASLETAELAKLLLLEGEFGFTETPTGQDDEKRRQYCYVLQSRSPTKSTRVLFTRRLLGSLLCSGGTARFACVLQPGARKLSELIEFPAGSPVSAAGAAEAP